MLLLSLQTPQEKTLTNSNPQEDLESIEENLLMSTPITPITLKMDDRLTITWHVRIMEDLDIARTEPWTPEEYI